MVEGSAFIVIGQPTPGENRAVGNEVYWKDAKCRDTANLGGAAGLKAKEENQVPL